MNTITRIITELYEKLVPLDDGVVVVVYLLSLLFFFQVIQKMFDVFGFAFELLLLMLFYLCGSVLLYHARFVGCGYRFILVVGGSYTQEQ